MRGQTRSMRGMLIETRARLGGIHADSSESWRVDRDRSTVAGWMQLRIGIVEPDDVVNSRLRIGWIAHCWRHHP